MAKDGRGSAIYAVTCSRQMPFYCYPKQLASYVFLSRETYDLSKNRGHLDEKLNTSHLQYFMHNIRMEMPVGKL